MGGAVPTEFKPSTETPTGIKNAAMSRELQRLGLPPFLETERQSNQALWDRTMARIDSEPGWQDAIIKDVKEHPRQLSDEEVFALDHRLVDLKIEYSRAAREAAQAYDDGRVEDVSAASTRARMWSEKLKELSEATKSAGTEWGRAGQARQRLFNSDFTLAEMEMRKREANGWRPLTDEERVALQKEHDAYQAKIAELEKHLAEERAKVVDAEIKRAFAEKEKGPQYSPAVLKYAEKFASYMDGQADAARARLRERLKRTNIAVDPTVVSDLAIIGAAKITRGIVDLVRWTEAMVRDLGEDFRPLITKEVYDAAEAKQIEELNAAEKATPGTKAAVKKGAVKPPPAERIKDARESIHKKAVKGDIDTLYPEVQKLIRAIIEQHPEMVKEMEKGVGLSKASREAVVDEVEGVLRDYLPAITREETLDAISGRGRFTLPRQDAVSRTVRDLKTQSRLIAHQLDVEARRALPRTGYQPEKMSDMARREEQRLNELKRRFGVVVTDPATQLASVLNARKTYYRNRLADLRHEITTRERTVKTRTPPPSDASLEALQKEYARVKEEHALIFQKPALTDAQRLQLAEKAADRQIAELQRQLATGEIFPGGIKPPGPTSPALEAKRAQIEALKSERDYARDLLQPKADPMVRALMAKRANMMRQIANLQQRIADGDYAKRVRPEFDISQDKRAMELKAELEHIRREFDRGLALDEARRRTLPAKVWAGIKETLNLPRAILASWDVSAVLRQGGFIAFGHPLRAASSIIPMFKALSERRALAIEQQILNRENALNGRYARSKLYLASLDEFRLSRKEEIMMSRFANAIPGVRQSNLAFMTFLNKLRADSFDSMVSSLERRGLTLEQAELDAIANYINIATGRGNIGAAAGAAETLSTAFFSPRLVASRFQLLAGEPLYHGSARTRFLVASEYARFLAGMAAIYGLGALAGAEIESDTHSSDFGKLRFGNTRIDPLTGLQQNTVLISRVLTGKTMTAKGKTLPIREYPMLVPSGRPQKVPYNAPRAGDLLWRFTRTKFNPTLGSAVDLFTGENVVGEKVTPTSVALRGLTPLSLRDVYDVMQEQGVPAGTAMGVLSLFGMGLQQYDAKKAKP